MLLSINHLYHLSPPATHDIPTLCEYLNDGEIHRNTLEVPSPYTEEDAEEWVDSIGQRCYDGQPTVFHIRDANELCLGAIGATPLDEESPRIFELGYWVGAPHRGKGIAPLAISRFCEYLNATFGTDCVEANVFNHNFASMRALEKAGFTLEGDSTHVYVKQHLTLYAKLYARYF